MLCLQIQCIAGDLHEVRGVDLIWSIITAIVIQILIIYRRTCWLRDLVQVTGGIFPLFSLRERQALKTGRNHSNSTIIRKYIDINIVGLLLVPLQSIYTMTFLINNHQ